MKTKELKKGISLIVLVITVIVMVILAGVIILTLDNSGIINKAQDAVDQANLNEVKNVAQLAWAEAFLDGKTTKGELEQAVIDALAKQNITADYYKGYTIEVTTSGVSFVASEGESKSNPLNHSGIIPEGATYTLTNGTVLKSGEVFPETVLEGDIYTYGDYEYRYNQVWTIKTNEWVNLSVPAEEGKIFVDGWGVRVLDDTKVAYNDILEAINNGYVTNMCATFMFCTELTTVPAIPPKIRSMFYAFAGCSSITDLSNLVIPSDVTDMESAFAANAINDLRDFVIPSKVTNLHGTFASCTALTDVSNLVIPNSVIDMSSTFNGCTSLTFAPDMSKAVNVTSMSNTFNNCSKLTVAPVIPNSVTDMRCAFLNCTSLTDISKLVISSKVTNLNGTFSGCTSLTGTVTVNANPQIYYGFFEGTVQPIVLTGSSTMLQEIAATATNGNVTVQE